MYNVIDIHRSREEEKKNSAVDMLDQTYTTLQVKQNKKNKKKLRYLQIPSDSDRTFDTLKGNCPIVEPSTLGHA